MSNRGLIDPQDGENRAVRAFLAGRELGMKTTAEMKLHMRWSGFPHWPEWANKPDAQGHLTKSGQQSWLRHLFGLEKGDAI